MDDLSATKIEQSRRDRKHLHNRFLKGSKAYSRFLQVERAAFAPGSLDTRHKELMALSISIVTKCEPCIEWHVEQALQAGATEADLMETIGVAIEMGGGPAGAYARFALQAYDHFAGADSVARHDT
jgi:AhpD family alkylhydroperoxidase